MEKLNPKNFAYQQYLRRQFYKKAAAAILFAFGLLMFVALNSCVSPSKEGPKPQPAAEEPTLADSVNLDWGNNTWSLFLTTAIKDQLPKLDKAKGDMKRFCPRYEALSPEGRVLAWAHLAVAIAKRESGYKPATVYMESNGVASIGLYQLSYGDRNCPKKQSDGDLKDPFVNIVCAVKLMGHFAELDGVVAAGGYVSYGAPPAKGLARYWSVIRVPDKKSKHHLDFIKAQTAKAPGC